MWRPYIEVARQCFGQAQLVIDRFHVVKALNNVLDKYRRDLRRENAGQESFKKTKWLLFKRPEKCSQEQKQRLKEAFAQSAMLEELYELRNTFNNLFDLSKDKDQLKGELDHWIAFARELKNESLDAFVKMLEG